MRPSFRFVCPKCGEKFPFWPWSCNYICNGLLSTPWLKCSRCGTMSRQTANWPHVLWAWPIAFLAVTSIIVSFHKTEDLVMLHRHHPGVYGVLGGLCMGLGMLVCRFGLKLAPVFGEPEARSISGSKTWLKVLLLAGFVAAIALITRRWTATLASFVAGLAVIGVFYLFQNKKDGLTAAPTGSRDGVPAAHDP